MHVPNKGLMRCPFHDIFFDMLEKKNNEHSLLSLIGRMFQLKCIMKRMWVNMHVSSKATFRYFLDDIK